MCKISDRDDAIKLGQCLGVPVDLLMRVDQQCQDNEHYTLEDIVYCSEQAVDEGQCPECEYEEISGGYCDVGAILRLIDSCVIHKWIFEKPFNNEGTVEQMNMYKLAIEKLTD